MLMDIYYQQDLRKDAAAEYIYDSENAETVAERLSTLKHAQQLYSDDGEIAYSKAIQSEILLVQFQLSLEREIGGDFIDLSIHDTLRYLVQHNHLPKAQRLVHDFKVTDKL